MLRPMIENSRKKKNRKADTFMNSGRDRIKVITSFFIRGMALIERRGRSTLIVLKDFRLKLPGMNSRMPEATTTKSITFQPSLRYDVLCRKKPNATILIMHSTVNTIVNIKPMSSKI